MDGRVTVIPNERLLHVRGLVESQLHEGAAGISGEGFCEFFDATMRAAFECGLKAIGADEGTVWLLDREASALVPRYNNGPDAAKWVGTFSLPLSSGLTSTVAITERPLCDNDVPRNAKHDGKLNDQLKIITRAMVAVPFYYADSLRGVLTAVQLSPAQEPLPERSGFAPDAIESMEFVSDVLTGLIECRLLRQTLGLEESF